VQPQPQSQAKTTVPAKQMAEAINMDIIIRYFFFIKAPFSFRLNKKIL
jgi:hypothetical protein